MKKKHKTIRGNIINLVLPLSFFHTLLYLYNIKNIQMKVIINDKEITLKSTFRAMVAYEQITDHIFSPTTVTDILVYFYCTIITSKDYDGTMTFDEFMDYLDENPTILQEFSEWMTETNKQAEVFSPKEAKKKTTARKK